MRGAHTVLFAFVTLVIVFFVALIVLWSNVWQKEKYKTTSTYFDIVFVAFLAF
jgi:hypothetical protein